MIVYRTPHFVKWFDKLRDAKGKMRLIYRFQRLTEGVFGDHKLIGDGVFELRDHYGSGYRIYYILQGDVAIVLLAGGDKDTQSRDIQRAKELAKQKWTFLEEGQENGK